MMLQPIVSDVHEAFDMDAPRLQRNALQADGGGSDIAGLHWLALEVKFHKAETDASVAQWWAQCVRQAGKDKVPVLLYRTNGRKWKCRMWGWLGTHSAGRTCAVTVAIEDFLMWFRLKLTEELS